MKTFFAIFISLLGLTFSSKADEGMWLPMLVERLNYVDMQKMGLNLTPEELYAINHSSLKDAIVGLGYEDRPMRHFCTAEVVSNQGLLMTNHHCAYEIIQSHSSTAHNYLDDGFWASTTQEELVAKKITASFLVRIENVTEDIMASLNDTMSLSTRNQTIEEVSAKIIDMANEGDKYASSVKSFFDGNEFYLFVYQVYKDVRLVGAPPSSIGKFGGDTDNWMWPRHTGDFAVLRVYTSPEGLPASYSPSNIPLTPKHFLPISLQGVNKGDFAMIWGYPGGTDRYKTSFSIERTILESNPTMVAIRDKKLAIIKEGMDKNNVTRIKYAAKHAAIANYWKYFIGETKGLKRLNVGFKKKQLENEFSAWVSLDPVRKELYGSVLQEMETAFEQTAPFNLPLIYYSDAFFNGAESVYFTYKCMNLITELQVKNKQPEKIQKLTEQLKNDAESHFQNMDNEVDMALLSAMLSLFYTHVEEAYHPALLSALSKKYKQNFMLFAKQAYKKSVFTNKERFLAFLDHPNVSTIQDDPLYELVDGFLIPYRQLGAKNNEFEEQLENSTRQFIAGLREMNPELVRYANANSTMRFTYGQVLDYRPADAIYYNFYTTLDGIMEKEDSTNEEFVVHPKLKELYLAKNYGRYANKDNQLPVCFITNNDITGGNSGSPVINKNGHLIGIAFDGNWEAMSGDIAFEKDIQRTINVDIRYVLFIMDKFAGAHHILDELTLIE